MAVFVGDADFAMLCDKLANNARSFADKKMFNDEYYEHLIKPPKGMTADELEFQLGPGCLVDQLAGQYMAHITGLGHLASEENIKTTLGSILKYNYKEGFDDHFNPMRSYTLGDESGLLMASWPKGRLKVPFPYFAETMTGFEYTAATGMIYEGMADEGLMVIESIRERYDGRKRNPFDEAECGHHYARAMAAWSPILALTGFYYSGVEKMMIFNPVEGNWFWSNGYSWGTIDLEHQKGGWDVTINVLYGKLKLKKFALKGIGKASFDKETTIFKDKSVALFIKEY
jgi:hypothetical protein